MDARSDSNPIPAPSGGLGGHPPGLRILFFTELWERFSYYGMRALLILFLVLPIADGGLGCSTARAALIYGTYTMSVYLLAIPGGYIADHFLGARRAVLIGGWVIALGHFALALPSDRGFAGGLALIALGTGLLKPNMSAMVGSLYAPNDPRRDAGFSIFYMGINLGAFAAPLVTGWLAQSEDFKARLAAGGFDPNHSWHWGFAAAGVGMTLGMAGFMVRGRQLREVGLPPAAGRARPWARLAGVAAATVGFFALVRIADLPGWTWLRYAFVAVPVAAILALGFRRSGEAKRTAAVLIFFLAALVFWMVFEQAGSTISLFCDRLTRHRAFGHSFPSAWFQSLNSLFVIALAPAFAWLWVRLGRGQPSSPVKFSIGLGLLGLSFLLLVPAARLTAAGPVSPLWIVGLFFLQSVGELCLSPVGLSTMTRLAPVRFVGLVMGIWFLADALGNKLAGIFAADFTSVDAAQLAHFFLVQSLWVGAATLALLALAPWMRRLMGDLR
jgi:POT family proton-dependent oligopeptide transporter